MKLELKKIHEDERRIIYLVKDLLPENKEFTFIRLNKGKAIGGCYHSEDEHYVVISGKTKVLIGNEEKKAVAGDSGIFPARVPHAFIALEDSIISEWGITTEEKEFNVKDPEMRQILDKLNKN
jgi:mannose-6-phosphate isomerase-like protein (cupin superfamily)